MIDFSPLLKQPVMLFFGAAAQFGIFMAMFLAASTGAFDIKESASIGIIGAADGPTSIYAATRFAPNLLGPISVAAYSYMALVPMIQPPIIRALTTKKNGDTHGCRLRCQGVKKVLILFPIVVTL